MRLVELFQATAQPLQQQGNEWVGEWNDDTQQFQISFQPDDHYSGCYEFWFSPTNNRPRGFLYYKDQLNRPKSASGVLGQVVAYVRQFIAQVKPVGLLYHQLEDKRARIYSTILRVLAKELASQGYTIVQPDESTVLLVQRRSRAYLQYVAQWSKQKYEAMRDRLSP